MKLHTTRISVYIMSENEEIIIKDIKSIIADSSLFKSVLAKLKENDLRVRIDICPHQDLRIRVFNNIEIPKWTASFVANNPHGAMYNIAFEDGEKGSVWVNSDNTISPMCKRSKEYEDKTFVTIDAAVEALYISMKKNKE